MRMRRVLWLGLTALFGAASAAAATQDNNIEWGGLSHLEHYDRLPLCPVNGEAFQVRFKTYRFDLTSAGARVATNGNVTLIPAVYLQDDGPYAVWSVSIPATPSSTLQYWIEVTDGTDTDYISETGITEESPVDGGFKLDFTNYRHAPYGATPCTTGVAFRVWASASRTQAYVRGVFNGWGLTNQMTRVGDDFIAYVPNAQAGQMYKFFFNPGAVWNSDPRAKAMNGADNYNAIIVNPSTYQWNDQSYVTPPFEEMVVYELHVGTFSGRNNPGSSGQIPATYRDVAANVQHLVELGVNAVELTPINEFPWDFSAGYNPITAYSPELKYGTPDDLRYMVDVLHQNGIAVILDIVWNHFSSSDNFLWNYDGTQLYFDNPAIDTPWGAQADFDKPQVRKYFVDSAVEWIEHFHIDGFRMDATDFMNIGAQEAAGWALMQEYNNLMDRRYAHKVSIAEQLPDDPWVTRPTGLGGAGFDSQWYDFYVDNLRQEIFDAGFGNPEMFKIANIINQGTQYLSGTSAFTYFELHDEAWSSSGGQRAVRTIDNTAPYDSEFAMGRTKLAHGVVFTSPGIPGMLQGNEWLEDTNFGGGSPSGADRIDWSKKNTYRGIFDFYSDAINIRRTNGGLRSDAGKQILHLNESGNVIAWQRFDLSGNVLVMVANFSNTDFANYQVGVPQAGTYYELINSEHPAYLGSGPTNCAPLAADGGAYDGQPFSVRMNVPAMGFMVLRWNDPPDLFLDGDQDSILDVCDNCPSVANTNQADSDMDGLGDACDLVQLDGDMNCDGVITVGDISGFVLALTDPTGYAAAYPGCQIANADINDDGTISVGDIGAFVSLVTGG